MNDLVLLLATELNQPVGDCLSVSAAEGGQD